MGFRNSLRFRLFKFPFVASWWRYTFYLHCPWFRHARLQSRPVRKPDYCRQLSPERRFLGLDGWHYYKQLLSFESLKKSLPLSKYCHIHTGYARFINSLSTFALSPNYLKCRHATSILSFVFFSSNVKYLRNGVLVINVVRRAERCSILIFDIDLRHNPREPRHNSVEYRGTTDLQAGNQKQPSKVPSYARAKMADELTTDY